jgi:hypothetical protein
MQAESFSSSQVIQELRRIQAEASRGAQALFDAEVSLANADSEADLAYQRSFIRASGSVELRKAIASVESADARLEADLRKAEVNRIKTKLKQLELAQMSTQTIARQIETEMRMSVG